MRRGSFRRGRNAPFLEDGSGRDFAKLAQSSFQLLVTFLRRGIANLPNGNDSKAETNDVNQSHEEDSATARFCSNEIHSIKIVTTSSIFAFDTCAHESRWIGRGGVIMYYDRQLIGCDIVH